MLQLEQPKPVDIWVPPTGGNDHTEYPTSYAIPMYTKLFREECLLSQAIQEADERKDENSLWRIGSAGCSIAAEADSILALLNKSGQEGTVVMRGWDRNERAIAAAQAGHYLIPQVLHRGTEWNGEELQAMLDEYGFGHDFVNLVYLKSQTGRRLGHYQADASPVRQAHDVVFTQCDLSEGIPPEEPLDLVLANNMFYHLPPREASRAIMNLAGALKETGILSIGDSTDLLYMPMGDRNSSGNWVSAWIGYGHWLEATAEVLEAEFGMQAVCTPQGLPMMFGRA